MNTRARRLALFAAVAMLCTLHTWMAASVSRTFSTTFDEIAHLTAGYTYWTQGDYRFQPENGNLPQRLAALPLLWQDTNFPAPEGEAWRTANVWRIGHVFFHESGNDLPAMLAAGRAMNALLSGLLCLVVFLWTRNLFGPRAALLALLLACFSPTLLAHGGLITSDTAAALGFAVASLAWWRLLHRVSPARIVAAGLAAGLLALSKYSVVLFAPMAMLLTLLRLGRDAPLPFICGSRITRINGWQRLPALAAVSLVAAGICITVIWAGYGFRYSATPPDAPAGAIFAQTWDEVLLNNPGPDAALSEGDRIDLTPGPIQHFVRWARDHELLPEAWLYGLTFVEKHSRGRMAYFAGEYRLTGWRSFFPTVFLLKTTLPSLALIALGLAGLAAIPRERRCVWLQRIASLLVLVAVYSIFSILSALNIGHRHLLPIYPALFVLAGGGLLLVRRHQGWALVLVALLIWHTRESLTIRPDYLAHFNPLAGGPENARRLFVDSSLDWGQDLPRLRAWLDANARDERVYLSYFGTGSPTHAGIHATRIGDALFDPEARSSVPRLEPGIYCISATMFSQVYTGNMRPWSPQNERDYGVLVRWLEHLHSSPAGASPTWLDGSSLSTAQTTNRLVDYEALLFARLCHFLESREPDAQVGHSIRVFKLTDADLADFMTVR